MPMKMMPSVPCGPGWRLWLPCQSSHPRYNRPSGSQRLPLQVRIGIHTGLVVIGEIGSSDKREHPGRWARRPTSPRGCKGMAEPDTVVDQRGHRIGWCRGLFECQDRGTADAEGRLDAADGVPGACGRVRRRAALRWRSGKA